MLERKIKDHEASDELLEDRKQQTKMFALLQGMLGIFALVLGLYLLNTPGMRLIDGLIILILSIIPLMLFASYCIKADYYNILLKLNAMQDKKNPVHRQIMKERKNLEKKEEKKGV